MNLKSYANKILASTPISYIVYKIIRNSNKEIIDFRPLDYNPSYLKLISKGNSIKEDEMKDFIINIKNNSPEINQSILNSKDLKITEYIASYDKWLDILILYQNDDIFIIQIKDITKEKTLENQLKEKAEEFALITNAVDDLLLTTDLNGIIIHANKSWEKTLGYKLDEIIDNTFKFFLDQASYEKTRATFQSREMFEEGYITRTIMQRKDGKYSTIEWNSSLQSDYIYSVGRDITRLVEAQEKVLHLSYHDKLTGLYNRSFFEEELKRLDNDRNLPISIIMGDINGLKIINDVFGHAKGDKLLKNIANILNASIRQGDILSRWGGDEFIILLPNTDEKTTIKIIDRISNACKKKSPLLNHSSISLGYDIKLYPKKDISEVLTNAENDMYKNKAKDGEVFRRRILNSMEKYLKNENIESDLAIEKTKEYLKKISNHLSLSKDDLDKLLLLADIHDIGLISVAKPILNKKGILTQAECEKIKNHVEVGYRIAKAIPETAHIANYILHHHERYDGSGYPHGLKGEEIPFLNRIFSVIDTFTNQYQSKSYGDDLKKPEIINSLKANSGKLFDPRIVYLFLAILEEEEK